MKSKISVVVPVYNTQKYLKRSLDSLVNQNRTDYEIVIVDDGSSDNSLQICSEYAQKYDFIKIYSKENGGVSSARNYGIDKARGEYICFVDSDDSVSENYLSLLYKNIQNADISIGSYQIVRESENIPFLAVDKSFNLKQFKENFLITFSSLYMNSPCNKMFKKEIIKNNNLFFPVGVNMGEDSVFVVSYLACCEKINCFSDIIYNYYQVLRNSKEEYLKDRVIMIKNFEKFFDGIDNYALKVLLLREYLSAIKEDILYNKSISDKTEHFEKYILDNNLDDFIKSIKIPFYKKVLAYQWFILLEKKKYKEYIERYILS